MTTIHFEESNRLMEEEDDQISMNSVPLEINFAEPEVTRKRSSSKRRHVLIGGIIILLVVIIVVVVIATQVKKNKNGSKREVEAFSASVYSKAAVAADNEECSKVGKKILAKNGNAVDASIAGLFCLGLLHMHSCGIGGGGFLMFYNRTEKKSYVYDFREEAPGFATENMYNVTEKPFGGRSIAIPGNIKGLYHIWKKHGSLKWADLIQPTIDFAENGFTISKALSGSIKPKNLENDPGFREFLKKPDDTWYKAGDVIKANVLAETLKIIQKDPESFYTGSLAKEIVKDVKDAGGNITEEDLESYRVKERDVLSLKLDDKNFYFMPPPGSGAVIAMIMNILHGFGLSKKDFEDNENVVKTTHKIIEAFKFAFARRPFLADPDFSVNVSKAVNSLMNSTLAEACRKKIKLDRIYYNETFYGGYYQQPPDLYGTSHLSVLAENGDAVAATDTINYGFGSRVRSLRNGIIYNNEMDDFSSPGKPNLYGYPPVPANFIRPGKRPLSSMSPTIVTDKNGDVKMIAGASGGSRIITATAQVLIKKLYLNMELGESVSQPRVHHQLIPYAVQVSEKTMIPKYLQDGLSRIGHKIKISSYISVVQTIFKTHGEIHAVSDPRKGGKPDGY